MNVQMHFMDARIARIHYLDYKKKVVQHREVRKAAAEKTVKEGKQILRRGRVERELIEKEDTFLRDMYKAMSQGQRVLNLGSVLKTAGLNAQKLPVLAVAQADWKTVWLTRTPTGQFAFNGKGPWGARCRDGTWLDGTLAFVSATFGDELIDTAWRDRNNYSRLPVKAMVPSIPAHLRPDANLREFHILFEAEWTAAPPVDPILLRRCGPDNPMFSVVAQWDLSPVERAVLEGRIT